MCEKQVKINCIKNKFTYFKMLGNLNFYLLNTCQYAIIGLPT